MTLRDPAKKKARDRRLRQRHAARIASGRCTRCGRFPPEPGLKVCSGCAEKRRAADRARRARARAEGKQYGGRDPERCRRSRPRRRQAAAERVEGGGTMHILRPPPAGGEPLRLRAMPRGASRTRPPALWRAPRRRPLRTLHAAHGRGPVALRPLPRAGEGARLSRARERRRQETLRKTARAGRNVWIVESPPVARPAVSAAHIVPTPALPSDTWRCSGRRRFPWSNWRRARSWALFETESEAAACIAFARLRLDQVEIRLQRAADGAVAVMSADPPRASDGEPAPDNRDPESASATAVTGRAVRETLVNPADLGPGGRREEGRAWRR